MIVTQKRFFVIRYLIQCKYFKPNKVDGSNHGLSSPVNMKSMVGLCTFSYILFLIGIIKMIDWSWHGLLQDHSGISIVTCARLNSSKWADICSACLLNKIYFMSHLLSFHALCNLLQDSFIISTCLIASSKKWTFLPCNLIIIEWNINCQVMVGDIRCRPIKYKLNLWVSTRSVSTRVD